MHLSKNGTIGFEPWPYFFGGQPLLSDEALISLSLWMPPFSQGKLSLCAAGPATARMSHARGASSCVCVCVFFFLQHLVVYLFAFYPARPGQVYSLTRKKVASVRLEEVCRRPAVAVLSLFAGRSLVERSCRDSLRGSVAKSHAA